MGVAAYNRGSKAIREHINATRRPAEFLLMDDLNSLPKYEDAGQPFGPLVFQYDGRMWWALDPIRRFAGFGYWYPTLREAVRRWNVSVTSYDGTAWGAVPRPRLSA
jgi:hypothetical protein